MSNVSSKTKASDILTDKAKWLTSVLRTHLKDTSDDSASALFHTVREHMAMLTTELLLTLLNENDTKDSRDDAEFLVVGSQQEDQYIGPFFSQEEAEKFGNTVIGAPESQPWFVAELTTLNAARKQFSDEQRS